MIYGGIVLLWLCYLVPLALRRYDEAARTRSVERFSTAMRVLGSTDVGEPLLRERSLHPRARAAAPVGSKPVDVRVQRAAARAAAARRRRVLAGLCILGLGTAAACAAGLAPWWALAAPLGLVLGFLVLARTQVARARNRSWEGSLSGAGAGQAAATYNAGDPPDEAPTVVLDAFDPAGTAVAEQEQLQPQQMVAAPVATTDGGSLWDPLPLTLPTYVTKPRATRSVRTIDLGAPVAWTSGRLTPDGALRDGPESAAGSPGGDGDRRAAEVDRAATARAVGD